jgi:hypothetical protein
MNLRRHGIRGVASLVAACCLTTTAAAVTLDFVGSQANLDNGFFPGGQLPYVTE